ncbi:hypothetical protein BpHYR1_038639 [Brachionus plicatilis]|uniref:Uncharacterized protein n=1 Tax=Brachionus plicatilis TaxID=10195 RepID=A0A3M7QN67_BRAPC|nr:hypothetical protein BpHYR1_038639 [Brachionus plicatilis]
MHGFSLFKYGSEIQSYNKRGSDLYGDDMGLVPMICDKVDSFDCHVVRSGTGNFHMLDGHKPFQ